jgi:hypothetical protein
VAADRGVGFEADAAEVLAAGEVDVGVEGPRSSETVGSVLTSSMPRLHQRTATVCGDP